MPSLGIPKEIKSLEKRVGLTPGGVQAVCEKGVKVYVEHNAGLESGFADLEFQNAGAVIVPDAASVYSQADIIQKVKEPLEAEYKLLRKHQVLFCYLHLASPENCALVETLVRSGSTAIGYETVELGGRFPLLAPMSEIAGALAAAYGCALKNFGLNNAVRMASSVACAFLEQVAQQYPRFDAVPQPMGKVVIYGGGVAGFKAMETALKLKAEVTLIEKNSERREFLKRFVPSVYAPEDCPKSHLEKAEVLIGCVHARGARAAQVMDEKLFSEISRKKNKAIIDVAIDQGGNFPESGPTSYKDPLYYDSHRNLRFGVANMPSLCGKGASEALTRVTLPYTLALAQDIPATLSKFPELAAGINIRDGKIQLEVIQHAHRRL